MFNKKDMRRLFDCIDKSNMSDEELQKRGIYKDNIANEKEALFQKLLFETKNDKDFYRAILFVFDNVLENMSYQEVLSVLRTVYNRPSYEMSEVSVFMNIINNIDKAIRTEDREDRNRFYDNINSDINMLHKHNKHKEKESLSINITDEIIAELIRQNENRT